MTLTSMFWNHRSRVTGGGRAGLALPDPLAGFRAAVLRRSIPVLGVVVAVLTVVAMIDGHRFDATTVAFLGLVTVGLALASLVPWERSVGGAGSDESWAPWAWSVIVALVLGSIALLPAVAVTARPLLAGVVVMTGLVLGRARHVIVTVLTLLLVVASNVIAGTMSVAVFSGPIVIVALASLSAGFAGRQLERSCNDDRRHLAELEHERTAFARLYALAETLGGSESVEETLPLLLQRLCRYLDSGVGVWVIANESKGTLAVAPPIHRHGRDEIIDGLPEVDAAGGSFVARALRSETVMSVHVDRSRMERNGVLGALGVEVAAAAPLIVEGRRIGVLLVGDPASGSYDPEALHELEVMARPAALVLGQLVRHEKSVEMADRLRDLADMKSDFVAVVSHELRTPLTSIRAALDTLVRPEMTGSNPLAVDLLDSARRQTGRLERLIDDLLIASRVDRGTLRPDVVPVALADVFDDVLPTIDSDLVVADLDPDLVVLADTSQLGQVIRNLVENAVKYADGSPVLVAGVREPFGASIVVADNGPGIAPADRDRIFRRFEQLERPDRRSREGSGLGLAIAAELVEAMGGRIGVEETPGGGATFRVSFRVPARSSLPV